MTCYAPVEVGIKRKPLLKGGRSFYTSQTVPCGVCLGCRADQARDWSIRIMHETQMHDSAWFLTLTYSNERLPEDGSLAPEDLRAFFKAVRRDYPPSSISYFACGEYGETTQRPHYHSVLYGPDFLDRSALRSTSHGVVWRSDTLEKYWPHGLCEFGTVTPASAAYVAGYVQKKISKRQNPDAYLRVDDETGELLEVVPEFARMSLKPAIGLRWIEKYWPEVYPLDRVVMDGREYKPPRYYDKWLEKNNPQMAMEVRLKRYEEMVELTAEKLDAKRANHEARKSLFGKRNKV